MIDTTLLSATLVLGIIAFTIQLQMLRSRDHEISFFIDIISDIADRMGKGYSISEVVSDLTSKNKGHKSMEILTMISEGFNNGTDSLIIKTQLNKRFPHYKLIIEALISAFSNEYEGSAILKEMESDLRDLENIRFEKITKTSSTANVILFTSVLAVPIMIVMMNRSFSVPLDNFISAITVTQGVISSVFYGLVKENIALSISLIVLSGSTILLIFNLFGV